MPRARNKKSISNKLSGQIGKEQHFVKAIPKRVNNFLSEKLGGERGNLIRNVSVSVFILEEKHFH